MPRGWRTTGAITHGQPRVSSAINGSLCCSGASPKPGPRRAATLPPGSTPAPCSRAQPSPVLLGRGWCPPFPACDPLPGSAVPSEARGGKRVCSPCGFGHGTRSSGWLAWVLPAGTDLRSEENPTLLSTLYCQK